MRVECGCGADGGQRGDAVGLGIEAARCGASVRRQSRAQRGAGDQQRGARIGEHEGEPLGRVVGVERQIGAAGLEDAEQPDQHLERALDAQPHHHLGADPVRAQMMRELARARIELAIAQAVLLEHHRNRVRASAPPARQTAPAASRAGPRARCRSTPAGCDGAPPAPGCPACRSAASGCATAASSSRISRSAMASTLARSNRSLAYSSTPASPPGVPSAPSCSARLSDRSNFALAVSTGSKPPAVPASSSPSARRCSATPASPGTADGAPASAPD